MPSLRPLALAASLVTPRRHAGTLAVAKAVALPDTLAGLPAPSCPLKPKTEAKPEVKPR